MEQEKYQEEILRLLNLILEELRRNQQGEAPDQHREENLDLKYYELDFLEEWDEFCDQYFPRFVPGKYGAQRANLLIKHAVERHVGFAFSEREKVEGWRLQIWEEFRKNGKPYTFKEWLVAIYMGEFDPKWIRNIGELYSSMIKEAVVEEVGKTL